MINGIFLHPSASPLTPLPFEHPNLYMILGHQMINLEAFMDLPASLVAQWQRIHLPMQETQV